MKFSLTLGTGLPLSISSDNLCFLIDTGSTYNILFSFVYEHFKDRFKVLEERRNIIGIDGVQHEAPTIEAIFNFEGMLHLLLCHTRCLRSSRAGAGRDRCTNSWCTRHSVPC